MTRCQALIRSGGRKNDSYRQCKHDGAIQKVLRSAFPGQVEEEANLCYLHIMQAHRKGSIDLVTGTDGPDRTGRGHNLVGHTVRLAPLEKERTS